MPRTPSTGAVAGLIALDIFNNTKVNDFSRKIELCCGEGKNKRKVRAALKKNIQHERLEIGKAFLIRHKRPDENIDATSSVLCALIESHGYGEKIEEKAVEYTGEETAKAKEKIAFILAETTINTQPKTVKASMQRIIIAKMMMMDLRDKRVQKFDSNVDDVKAFIASLKVLCSMQTAREQANVRNHAVIKYNHDKKREEETRFFVDITTWMT
jgi:hypothetical protein